MKSLLGGLAALAMLTPMHAQAQTETARATNSWMAVCTRLVEADGITFASAREACACGAGVMYGKFSLRQYAIMGRLSTHTDNEDAMVADIRMMIQEGYSAEEIVEVGELMQEYASEIDKACTVLEKYE